VFVPRNECDPRNEATSSIVESSLLALTCMASRLFDDGVGMKWRVWSTVPISGAVINPGFDKGWLTFESDEGALRRLAPIPEGWEDLSEMRLVGLLQRSNEVPRHTGPMRRASRPSLDSDRRDRS
jgi:hypothetical protein